MRMLNGTECQKECDTFTEPAASAAEKEDIVIVEGGPWLWKSDVDGDLRL
jgi:hypothetical protein